VTLPELLDLLATLADVPGETDGLSELDHGLQCAHELSRVRPNDTELHAAGLVHDIGHRFGPDEEHARLGADQVRDLFGQRVAGLVEAHVVAKRYLVGSDPAYAAALSAVSTTTLGLQGGPLSAAEARSFLASPHATDTVVLRRADDNAKVPGRSVPGLEHWIPQLRSVVLGR
jgi:predicted HD phosphohydrolase